MVGPIVGLLTFISVSRRLSFSSHIIFTAAVLIYSHHFNCNIRACGYVNFNIQSLEHLIFDLQSSGCRISHGCPHPQQIGSYSPRQDAGYLLLAPPLQITSSHGHDSNSIFCPNFDPPLLPREKDCRWDRKHRIRPFCFLLFHFVFRLVKLPVHYHTWK